MKTHSHDYHDFEILFITWNKWQAKHLALLPVAYPFPIPQILDYSKLKEFRDDNFEFYENGGKFSKRVENSLQAISLFPTVFSTDV